MTKAYGTPRVLHIVETDEDGNRRTVRYFREDIIESFVRNVNEMLHKIFADSEKVGE